MAYINKVTRTIILFATTGVAWCLCMRSLFIWSGAQSILADPGIQSGKFLKVFMEYDPLPRMTGDPAIIWEGFFVCGLFAALAFVIVNAGLKHGWLRNGITFGVLHWLLMIPWFEFYLPYNVMNEPMLLVIFEGLLWLTTLMLTGIYMSFVMNFRVEPKVTAPRAGGKKIRLPAHDRYYNQDQVSADNRL